MSFDVLMNYDMVKKAQVIKFWTFLSPPFPFPQTITLPNSPSLSPSLSLPISLNYTHYFWKFPKLLIFYDGSLWFFLDAIGSSEYLFSFSRTTKITWIKWMKFVIDLVELAPHWVSICKAQMKQESRWVSDKAREKGWIAMPRNLVQVQANKS